MKKILAVLLDTLKKYDNEAELATDEHYEIIDVSDDPFLERIILDGKYFCPEEGIVCDNPNGFCHQSVANIMSNNRLDGDVLYTGFAKNLYNNEWFAHSFIVNNNEIIESGKNLFTGYFGIPLVDNEFDNFIEQWLA